MSDNFDALFKLHMKHYLKRFQNYASKAMDKSEAFECARAIFDFMQRCDRYLCDRDDELYALAKDNYSINKKQLDIFIRTALKAGFFHSRFFKEHNILTSAAIQKIAFEYAINDESDEGVVVYESKYLLICFPLHKNIIDFEKSENSSLELVFRESSPETLH